MARRAVLTGLLEAEEIEPLVVLVAAARHGREVIPPSAGQPCRAATFRGPLSAASTASARRVTAARLSGRPPAIAAAALATAAPPAAARPFLAGPLPLGPIAVSVRRSCPIGGDVGTRGRVRLCRPHEISSLERLVVEMLRARHGPRPVAAAGGGTRLLPLAAAPSTSPATAAAPPPAPAASGVTLAVRRLAFGPVTTVRRPGFPALITWSHRLVPPFALTAVVPLHPRVAPLRPTGPVSGKFVGSGLDGIGTLAGAGPSLTAVIEAAARRAFAGLVAALAPAAATSTPPPPSPTPASLAILSRGFHRTAVFAAAFTGAAAGIGSALLAAGAALWPHIGAPLFAGLLNRTGGRPPRSG